MGFTHKITTKIAIPKISIDGRDAKRKKSKANQAYIQSLLRGTTKVESELKIALDNAMSASVWSWPNITRRQNGSTVSTPRNIVDTGELRNSLEIKTTFGKTQFNIFIKYKAEYANFVHYGGSILPYNNPNASRVLLPGRPWVSATLEGTHGIEKYDLGGTLGRHLPTEI